MSQNVSLSDALFARLQSHAIPLVDTPESVISKALDALEQGSGRVAAPMGPRALNPAAPPNLHYTTVKQVTLNGSVLPKSQTYWNHLMYACARAAAAQGLSSQQVHALMVVPAAFGEKTDNGYKYLPEVGISIQGQDANGAWKQAHKIAAHLGLSLKVEFAWQNVEKAAMPNASGSLSLNFPPDPGPS